jgi:hypothetical protein
MATPAALQSKLTNALALQKARVALARAVYHDADIYLFGGLHFTRKDAQG